MILALEDELEFESADPDDSSDVPVTEETTFPTCAARRVQVKQSPYLLAFHRHHKVKLIVDSGAETNMIKESVALGIGARIVKSSQKSFQADGETLLDIVGETRLTLSRGSHSFFLDALVVRSLDVDILAGVPFMEYNDIGTFPARRIIVLADGTEVSYGSSPSVATPTTRRLSTPMILRAPPTCTTIWPGDFIEVEAPAELDNLPIALEPRTDKDHQQSPNWPTPDIIHCIAGRVRIPNDTNEPIVVPRHGHFAQVRRLAPDLPAVIEHGHVSPQPGDFPIRSGGIPHSRNVSVDPDGILEPSDRLSFEQLHREYDSVFDPQFDGYNGASGPFQAVVNMGPVKPPQRKGRVPQYSKDNLQLLQDKFDELESLGVFRKPEDINVVAEYLNPSFLVSKPNGGHRLVTAFAEVGRYCKPQPSLLPDVDSTLRLIGSWNYIITTDLLSAFYQIPLSSESVKYCGVATPYKGVRVYTRCAMGMPGSESALEELMTRIVGTLTQEGRVAKLADDLYCGGNSISEVLTNWRLVLEAMHKNGISLSAKKTVICPKTTTVLGWIWTSGSLKASPHRISTLAQCALPQTVRAMRSFLGAYKVLSRVIPNCAQLLAPLESCVAGKQSQDKIAWSTDLEDAFKHCQDRLSSHRDITIPRPDDQLWIVTDGSCKSRGLGATLYVSRDDRTILAGFFSAKLRQRQVTWLPCELEALSISAAIKHFSPYLVQSSKRACVLTDSKPCVQAFGKLCRGEFSHSCRVSTFLTDVSRYHVSVLHLAGTANLPSDFASRNAPECLNPTCQICSFVALSTCSTVLHITAQDITSGRARLPFTNRQAWLATQSECPDLRRTLAHLKQGTRPSRKATKIKDVKRYLNSVTIAKDGLLVVRQEQPFSPTAERIVVPRSVLDGLVTALHIQLLHPTAHQLKKAMHRHFFALDLDASVEQACASCHQCAALRKVPSSLPQSYTTEPPKGVGVACAADVLRRTRQCILVLREGVTSYTKACIIPDETAKTIGDSLICLCVDLVPLDGPPLLVRVDPAPCFQSLVRSGALEHHRIALDIGHAKNVNKNPVAEKCIQELEEELLRLDPSGAPVTVPNLAVAVATLNARIRGRGLSAREMWHHRDMFTNEQLAFSDVELSLTQHESRIANHTHSACSKFPKACSGSGPHNIQIGDIVYLHSDRNKALARCRYLVVATDGEWCHVRKFTSNQLRSTTYKVRKSDCYCVPQDLPPRVPRVTKESDSDEASDTEPVPFVAPTPPSLHQPPPPWVPPLLTAPPTAAAGPRSPPLPCVPPPVMTSGPLDALPDNVPDAMPAVPPARVPDTESVDPPLRRSVRSRTQPSYLSDYDIS